MGMKNFVIAIDLQKDFVSGSLGTKEAEAIIPNVVEYIKANRAHYIFTRDTHGEGYLNTREGKMLPVKHCIKDTEGWEIDSRVMDAIQNSDWTYSIVDKKTFGTTEVEKTIRNLIEYMQQQIYERTFETDGHDLNITIFGLVTDICVVSNALMLRSAFPEATITVIGDCCAGTTPERHNAAMDVMSSCHIYINPNHKMVTHG